MYLTPIELKMEGATMRRLLRLVSAVLLGSVAAFAAPVPDKMAPDFTGETTGGEKVTLSDLRGKPVVLEWTNHECPYVRKHYESGNMQQTQRTVTEQGATWISIISSAPGEQGYVSPAEADRLTASRGVYANMVILDPDGTIGRLYDAKTTPQMVLIDEEGVVRYMGAIDDKPSARPSSLEGAKNYLLAAWGAYSGGEEIADKSTKPYGCSVKYAH
jgi:peroxiredoxin